VKKLGTIVAAVIFLGSLPVLAQTESENSRFSLAAYGGAWVPLGTEFSDTYKTGPGGGLTIGYDFSRSIQIILDFSYTYHGLNHDIFAPEYTVTGGNYGILSMVVGAKFYIPSEGKLEFFGTLGGGVFPSTIGELTVSLPGYAGEPRPKTTEERFGYIVGGGLEFLLSPALKLLGEIRFADLFPQSEGGDNDTHLRNLSFRLGARLLL
jgi:opacity protein-like surface antigen